MKYFLADSMTDSLSEVLTESFRMTIMTEPLADCTTEFPRLTV